MAAPTLDIVFDIDWTLFYDVPKEVYREGDPRFTTFEGRYYRMTDGAPALLASLLAIPNVDVRISYYSGASHARTVHFLRSIPLTSTETALDHAYQMFEIEDMVPVADAISTLPYAERFKKDLKKISGIDLSRAVLVEDIQNFVPPSQQDNVLWLQKTFNFVDNFDVSPVSGLKAAYDPKTRREWVLERNKAAWVYGIIATALKESSRRGTPFTSELQRLQYDGTGKVIDREDPSQIQFYLLGLREIKRHAYYQSVPLLVSKAQLCGEATQSLSH